MDPQDMMNHVLASNILVITTKEAFFVFLVGLILFLVGLLLLLVYAEIRK